VVVKRPVVVVVPGMRGVSVNCWYQYRGVVGARHFPSFDPLLLSPAAADGAKKAGFSSSLMSLLVVIDPPCLFLFCLPTPHANINTRIHNLLSPSPQPLPTSSPPHTTTTMRVSASILTVALVACAASADINACPSSTLLKTRGGGFFDKLDAKISSVTKGSNEVCNMSKGFQIMSCGMVGISRLCRSP